MKKSLLSFMAIFTISVGIIGCGGGSGGSGSTESGSSAGYDFYSYLVSKNSVAKSWDNYAFNDASGEVESTSINAQTSTENIISNTNAIITEPDETIEYNLLATSIKASNGTEQVYLKRYLNLGDYITVDYKFIEYFDTYSPHSGYVFNDVIKIQVDFNDGTFTYDYYAKDLGKVVTTSNLTIGSDSYTVFSIVNNN